MFVNKKSIFGPNRILLYINLKNYSVFEGRLCANTSCGSMPSIHFDAQAIVLMPGYTISTKDAFRERKPSIYHQDFGYDRFEFAES